MKTDLYIKLQKKFGGQWIASTRDGKKIYASAKKVDQVFDILKKKKVAPQKTVIGFIEKYGHISAHFSLPL